MISSRDVANTTAPPLWLAAAFQPPDPPVVPLGRAGLGAGGFVFTTGAGWWTTDFGVGLGGAVAVGTVVGVAVVVGAAGLCASSWAAAVF